MAVPAQGPAREALEAGGGLQGDAGAAGAPGATPGGPVESAARSEDAALLQPTGGTTGLPKFATLTHRNLLANAAQVRAWLEVEPRPGDAMLSALPYFHIYGLTVAMSFSLIGGMTQVMLPRFDAGQVLKTAAKARPRFFPARRSCTRLSPTTPARDGTTSPRSSAA